MRSTTIVAVGSLSLFIIMCAQAVQARGSSPSDPAIGVTTPLLSTVAGENRGGANIGAVIPLGSNSPLFIAPHLGLTFENRENQNSVGRFALGAHLQYDFLEKTGLTLYGYGGPSGVFIFNDDSFAFDIESGFGSRFRFTDIPDLFFNVQAGLGFRAYTNNGTGVGLRLGSETVLAGIHFQL